MPQPDSINVQHYFQDSRSIARGSVKARQKACAGLVSPPPPYINPTHSFGKSRGHKKSSARERGKEESLRAIYKPLRAILKSLQSNSPSGRLWQ